ncbi:MAG: DUF393 domain-containing protein [Ignavibacteriae bacterium]|nr:DUF393 domain-containing protein [Ignavibacteriota bacterium]
MESPNQPIVFFDSHCLLCNGSVQFILKHEKKHILQFAPFNGITYNKTIGYQSLNSVPDSIVVVHNKQLLTYSKAIIFILINMGSYWKALGIVAKIVPASISDFLYKIITANRYKWFGRTESCLLPSHTDSYRFLE